ncbi:integrin alpha-PS2 isoform X2 [Chelonus insularis]|uniref:integrin alpha-PS2 isoform X2 n=1 Tax=Chelonus insularis TaxID=460826 RepID=UPI00158F2993|nr:integrin alpha-PS2 isoform X2 [Chelonus insularis]
MSELCCFRALSLLIIVLGFYLTLWSTEAFNIETRHYTSYKQETKSMFGFSVAEYRDSSRRGWVVVGAPEAQTSQPNVYRGGAVYRCDVAVDDSCVPVEFDHQENNYIKNPNKPYNLIQIDNKTLQWFGATVSTSLVDGGPILACAPRYVFFSISQSKKDFGDSSRPSIVGNRRDPVGTCWVTNFTSSVEFAPCRTKNFGYHRQGYCQAGLGAAVSRDGERVFIGAPGSWYWQGQTYTQMLNNRGKVMFTKEGSPEEDDSYLGYSLTSGDFIGNGDTGTAVGMPRGYSLHGKVILLDSNMTNHQNITGEQMGAYFGYALASGDIDGDGLDDLIVGAPMYTIPDNPEMNIETGRIYIFYGKGPDKYRQFVTRDGESNRGRFGLSLASLGDVDRDGYGDFAVGAPYAGPEGRGAVYIYHGSHEGVLDVYSQVIHAEDLSNNVRTFGFSIAGGLDLDGNRYPDMVVGSYESGTAMFFRSRPVIKMVPQDTFVEFGSSSKLISLDDKECTLSDTTRVTCLPLKACFKYTGDGVSSTYEFNVQYVLDVKKTKSPRLFFLEHEGRNTLNHTITVDRNEQFCRTVRVYVTPSIRDKLTSLDAEMRMSLAEERWSDKRPRDPRILLRPVLATTSSKKDTLSIRKNCGPDNICTPDLQLTVTPSVTKYLFGSGKPYELEIYIKNANEDAFEATYNLILPPGVNYIKIKRIDKGEIPVQCSAPKQSNNNTLKCDIGNPLSKGNLVHFIVFLQPIDVHNEKSTYEFEMNVNSTNPEPTETTSDNIRHTSLEIWVETDLLIEGESKPKDLYYDPDNYTIINATTDVEYGPAFTHNYTIRNQGPSRIEEAEVFLIWPAATLAKDDLVYLLEQPETTGPLSCATANANPLSLKLEQRRKQYSYYSTTSGIVHENLAGSRKNINVHTGYEFSTEKSNFNKYIEKAQTTYHQGGSWSGGSSKVTSSTHGESNVNESNNKGVIIHESGGSTHGLGHDSIGIVHVSKDQGLLGSADLSNDNNQKTWQSHKFREQNKTYAIYGGSGERDSTVDSEEINRNVEVEQTYDDKRYFKNLEEEKIRQRNKERLLEEQRRAEEKNIRNKEYVYGTERHYENENTYTSSGPEIAHRLNFTQDTENYLNSLSRTLGYDNYYKQGNRYLQFLGRVRVSEDGKEYIEFKNGLIFPLRDRYGEQSYFTQSSTVDRSFKKIEAQIIQGDDGQVYCRLADDRQFPLQSSWSYTETRTYNVGGRSGDSASYGDKEFIEGTLKTHDSSWKQQTAGEEIETHKTQTHHEKKYMSERRHGTKVYSQEADAYGKIQNYEDGHSRYERSAENTYKLRQYQSHAEMYQGDGILFDPDEESESESEKILPLCEAARCVRLKCTLGRLEKDEEVSISARYRIKGTTLKKVALNEPVKISTQLVARITKLPFIGKPAEEMVKSHEMYTNVEPTVRLAESDTVPLWVVVLSACAGTVILLLLIFLLYKCGFFKRNRPSDVPERQPLNRNGHFHGDDHL